MKNLKFGTTNLHKLNEASSILGIELFGYNEDDLKKIKDACGGDIHEIQSMDIIEIVKDKAKKAYDILGKPVMVEDTGLFIESLKGFPGPFVKFIVDGPGIGLLFKMLEGSEDRGVKAITGVCMYDGEKYIIGYGELAGIIPLEPRGNKFGWSNAFQPEGSYKTFGEMSEEEKNEISMRKIAFQNFMKNLNT